MEERLRPLTEKECYSRLYGERNPLVTVISTESAPPWPVISAESLRQAFLDRLDLREGLGPEVDAEAA